MVALADMIVVLDNSYFHIFSWYACSLQCATNIVNHVTPRVLDLCTLYYTPVMKKLKKCNKVGIKEK